MAGCYMMETLNVKELNNPFLNFHWIFSLKEQLCPNVFQANFHYLKESRNTEEHLWKTAFNKFQVKELWSADHTNSIF